MEGQIKWREGGDARDDDDGRRSYSKRFIKWSGEFEERKLG